MVKECIPKSLQEALEFINENESTIISGGTDLMVQKRNWANVPAQFNKDLIYIFNLNELKEIEFKDDLLHIGACTPVSDIVNHEKCPKSLKEAINIMASPALRNLATLAGNIVNASPAGDTLPILYMLNAKIVVKSVSNKRVIPIQDLITGPRKTTLKNNELISEIIIPVHQHTNEVFHKVGGRKADAISKVSMAALVEEKANKIVEFRVAFGAVGPTVIRNEQIEKKYVNKTKEEFVHLLPIIIKDYKEIVKPIDDQRSNKQYRKNVALNLLENFIKTM